MNESDKKTINIMRLTTFYLTPFAVVLILSGLTFGGQTFASSKLILCLLVITTLFNVATLFYVSKQPAKIALIRRTRVVFNYTFNIAFVFFMLNYWPSIWLLFLLTMIVIGIFDSREAIFANATSLSFMLLFIHYHHNILFGERLGFMLISILALFVTSFFINHVIQVIREEES